jgi:hypothetical protein
VASGKASATSLDGRRSFKRTEHLAPSPRRFVVGRGMVVDFVTCAYVGSTDKLTNSYVKSFLVAEKDRPDKFFDIDDGTKHPNMNLDVAKYIFLIWPPTSEKLLPAI